MLLRVVRTNGSKGRGAFPEHLILPQHHCAAITVIRSLMDYAVCGVEGSVIREVKYVEEFENARFVLFEQLSTLT